MALDDEAARVLDEQSGELHSQDPSTRAHPGAAKFQNQGASDAWLTERGAEGWYNDSGGASRFFYVAKAPRAERGAFNHHPTVKPVDLMRWLIRLVAKPGDTILDPFMGSGTTGVAATLEGVGFVGIEREEDYLEIARRRIVATQPNLFGTEAA